jgi:3-deoxy-manno-octulosonate cytidylyltransferase (CMP-KDO synthetase)
MVQWVYEAASRAGCVDRTLVATDDERIHAAVRGFGGEVAMTSSKHRSGTDRVAEVAEKLPSDIIVNLQGDEPFLDPALIDVAVTQVVSNDAVALGTLKCILKDREELESPHVVKVVVDRNDFALYFSRAPIPSIRDSGGDSALGFKHIGLYVYRRPALLALAALDPSPLEKAEGLEQLRALENGYPIKVPTVECNVIGVDTPEDLEVARRLAATAKQG